MISQDLKQRGQGKVQVIYKQLIIQNQFDLEITIGISTILGRPDQCFVRTQVFS